MSRYTQPDTKHVPPFSTQELENHLRETLPMNVELHDRILATFAALDKRVAALEAEVAKLRYRF